MRSRTATWFICKIAYEKTLENGMQKKTTELFVVDAVSFTEAEGLIIGKMQEFISGEFSVKDLTIAPYREVFFSDKVEDEVGTVSQWFKAKVEFINIDEKSEKEKRSSVYYLVEGGCLEDARKNIDEVMKSSLFDYTIADINSTKIIDVFEFIAAEK